MKERKNYNINFSWEKSQLNNNNNYHLPTSYYELETVLGILHLISVIVK